MTYLVAADSDFPKRVKEIGYSGIDAIGDPCKGLDQIKLSTLNSIINSIDYDPDFMMTDESLVYHESKEDGPWMWIFPLVFLNTMANLDKSLIPSIIDKWLKTDEFQLPHMHNAKGDAQEYFDIIRNNCIRCVGKSWSMYLYVSL